MLPTIIGIFSINIVIIVNLQCPANLDVQNKRYVCVTLDQFGRPVLGPLVLLLPKFLIIRLSNLPILSIPSERYSRNGSCALILISTFLLVSVSISLIIEYILVLMECIPMILKGSQNILERTEVAIKNG
jgi:hypothetical protein